MNKMKDIKIAVCVILALFRLFFAWDWVSFNLRNQERRILALEQTARPLFIVDKYSSVEIRGQEVYPAPDKTHTLAEEIQLAEVEK